MPGDSAHPNTWPLPKFYFAVDLGDGETAHFAEVSGLETEIKAIEYRHGDSKVFSPIKMPGLRNVGNITLKKGVLESGSALWAWLADVRSNAIGRRTVVISLLNEGALPMMTWTLTNAFPVKLTSTDLSSDRDEVAVETLELAYETLAVKAA